MSKTEEVSLKDIDTKIEKLSLEKQKLLEKSLSSDDVDDVIKANDYLKSTSNKDKKGNIKAYIYSPEKDFYNGLGYKPTLKSTTYDLLRGMGQTPIIHSIISTRIEQVLNFSKFTLDYQKEGWSVRRKPGLFAQIRKSDMVKDEDKPKIEEIKNFIENGGKYHKWERNEDFTDFIKMFLRDCYELDQGVFEVDRDRKNDLYGYTPLDGATIRLLETIDPNHTNSIYEDKNGFLPIYAQVYNSQILKDPITKEPIVYYPWELCFSIRNKTTDIKRNGYGKSDLEILIEIVTYLLWGVQYNGNFFKQGSNPKGFFTISEGADPQMLEEFRGAWRNMVTGVAHSHKVPIFEGTKIDWVDMQASNKDMEFQLWNEFLVLVSCSVFKIDPSELGFQFKNQSNLFGQDGQKERLDHSKKKGLKPVLQHLQKEINKYIVSEIDPSFEFLFTCIDLDDESQVLENDIKKVTNGFMSMEDGFEKYSERKFDPNKDTILNQVYWQAQQSKQFGGEESNEAVDQMTGEPDEGVQNPFDDYEKSIYSDPIAMEASSYINRMLKK